MVTRRALLGAGAVALLAGCGPPDEPEVDARKVLTDQLRVTQAVVAGYTGVPGTGRANALARVKRIQAALPGSTSAISRAGDAAGSLEAALAAEQEALRTHVAAIGLLKDRDNRDLLAGLVADAATGESALLMRLNRPPSPTAFPGQPA